MRLLEIPEATIRAEIASLASGPQTPFAQGAIAALDWILTRNETPSAIRAARAHLPALVSKAPE